MKPRDVLTQKWLMAVGVLLMMGLVWGCESQTATPDLVASKEQEIVDTFKALTANLEFPDHFMIEDAVKIGGEFDVNEYFTVLNRLSMEPGYTLDYAYYNTFSGGHPVIYARKDDETPFNTFDEFFYEFFDEFHEVLGSPAYDETFDRYLAHVQTDGTDEGYFQFAILHLLGDQFYLSWHANYHDAQIICDQMAMEDLLTSKVWYGDGEILADMLDSKQLKEMRNADLSPHVEVEGDIVRVRMTYFTHWGGLIEGIWEINKTFPHHVTWTRETLVEYDYGPQF